MKTNKIHKKLTRGSFGGFSPGVAFLLSQDSFCFETSNFLLLFFSSQRFSLLKKSFQKYFFLKNNIGLLLMQRYLLELERPRGSAALMGHETDIFDRGRNLSAADSFR